MTKITPHGHVTIGNEIYGYVMTEEKKMKKWFKKRGVAPEKEQYGRSPMIAEAEKTDEERKLEAIEKRVKQLECSHTSGWCYRTPSYERSTFAVFLTGHKKVCSSCGKEIVLPEEQWLQEQADEAYKKHEGFIEQINELETETK